MTGCHRRTQKTPLEGPWDGGRSTGGMAWGLSAAFALVCLVGCGSGEGGEAGEPAAGGASAADATPEVPGFEPDPGWPELPDEWVMASGLGLDVDEGGHVWVSHRAELLGPDDLSGGTGPSRVPAPVVMRIDPAGDVVGGWGSHEESDGWPSVLHGLFVDHRGDLWSAARDQHQVIKFDREGEVLLTIGREGETGGSDDPELLGRPADLYVDPDTDEVFVADGYVNRRIVVFDGRTGDYLRHWGAYGEPPDDDAATGEGEGSPSQFSLVHAVAGSRDGLLYVADRNHSRIQVFRKDGEFVGERILRAGAGGAFDVAFSPDPEERFVYVADGTEHKVWVLRRSDLEVLAELGREGTEPGAFRRPHNLATDARGNLYVTEAAPGWRIQRLRYQGGVPYGGG